MWGIADEKHAGVVDAKPIWISPCAWLGARLLSRSADGPLFLSGGWPYGTGPGFLLVSLFLGIGAGLLPLLFLGSACFCDTKKAKGGGGMACRTAQGGGLATGVPGARFNLGKRGGGERAHGGHWGRPAQGHAAPTAL